MPECLCGILFAKTTSLIEHIQYHDNPHLLYSIEMFEWYNYVINGQMVE